MNALKIAIITSEHSPLGAFVYEHVLLKKVLRFGLVITYVTIEHFDL